MPAPPNRFAPVGMICAREEKKRSAVDALAITCYKIRMNNNDDKAKANLIRDGYLAAKDADDEKAFFAALLDWQADREEEERQKEEAETY